MYPFSHGGTNVKIKECIRTNRKSLALIVDENAELIIRAPKRMPMRQIEHFIREKEAWILKQQEKMRALPQRVEHHYQPGEMFWYLGRPITLAYKKDGRKAHLTRDTLFLPANKQEMAKEAVKGWYQERAKEVLNARVAEYECLTGFKSTGVRITFAKSRWGSCNAKNSLNFSARLVMAPVDVIDSVVVHELCHTIHHNHSSAFWNLVHRIMPDYEEKHQWLKRYHRQMEW